MKFSLFLLTNDFPHPQGIPCLHSSVPGVQSAVETDSGKNWVKKWVWMEDWVVVLDIFYVHPYLEKIPILTSIFQLGWNHQPEDWVVVLNIFRIFIPLCGNDPIWGASFSEGLQVATLDQKKWIPVNASNQSTSLNREFLRNHAKSAWESSDPQTGGLQIPEPCDTESWRPSFWEGPRNFRVIN